MIPTVFLKDQEYKKLENIEILKKNKKYLNFLKIKK